MQLAGMIGGIVGSMFVIQIVLWLITVQIMIIVSAVTQGQEDLVVKIITSTDVIVFPANQAITHAVWPAIFRIGNIIDRTSLIIIIAEA